MAVLALLGAGMGVGSCTLLCMVYARVLPGYTSLLVRIASLKVVRRKLLAMQKWSRQAGLSMDLMPAFSIREFTVEAAAESDGSADVTALEVTPPAQLLKAGRVVLYMHAGAHFLSSAAKERYVMAKLAQMTGARVVSPDYRMPPKHPFPCALLDVLNTYRWIRRTHPDASVVVGGSSAGGNLAFALLVKLAQLGEAQPACCVGLSPWLLLAPQKLHWARELPLFWFKDICNKALRQGSGGMMEGVLHDIAAANYFQAADPLDPLISPVLADASLVKRFPPCCLHAGGNESLRGDSQRMAEALEEAGVDCELKVYPNKGHCFQLNPREFRKSQSLDSIKEFVEKYW